MNSQLLNTLSDFFSTFKEALVLASNPEQLDKVIAGIDDAKDVLAKHDAAKADLDELATFKATKEKQLADIADAKVAAEEAAKLNTDQATALQKQADDLEVGKAAVANNMQALSDKVTEVEALHEKALAAQKEAEDTKAEAAQALAEANTLKQSYVAKLKTIAQAEGGADVGSSS